MSEHFLNIKSVLGIDNTSDLASVSVQRTNGIYFYEVDNIDIDDSGKPHRRDGYESSIYTGTGIRSLWANDEICLFAESTYFNRLNPDDTITHLIEQVNPTDPFCYVGHGNIAYFSNDSIIGYIDTQTGLPYPFPEPTEEFKKKMVGGHILEWYRSRLYAANGSNLFFSDATVPTQMDARKNAIAFPNRITMVKAVDDGLYISDSKNVYYESGASPFSPFSEIKKSNFPAIEGMSASTILKGKQVRKVAYWMTKYGPYAGFNEGLVMPQQQGKFEIDGLEIGTAFIKEDPYQQLITIGQYKSGEGGSSGMFRSPTPIMSANSTSV